MKDVRKLSRLNVKEKKEEGLIIIIEYGPNYIKFFAVTLTKYDEIWRKMNSNSGTLKFLKSGKNFE